MSIKSTTTLKRSEALRMFYELIAELRGGAPQMSNHELGDALDDLVEEKCDRERRPCFDNFQVEDDD